MSIDLTLATLKTPIGDLTVVVKADTIVICEFSDREERIARQLARYYGNAKIENGSLDHKTSACFEDYFGGKIDALNACKTAPMGSEYDLNVWHWLRKIPEGSTVHYGAIAQSLNSSPRAVGGANGRNPIALILPCHRVIGADGSLTGYAGGVKRKEWLLQHEGALLAV